MQWNDWIQIREAQESDRVADALVKQAQDIIDQHFDYLHKSLIKSFSKKPPVAEKFRQTLVADLNKIIEKIGGAKLVKEDIDNIEKLLVIAEDKAAQVKKTYGLDAEASGKYDLKKFLDSIKEKMKNLISQVANKIVDARIGSLTTKVGELVSKQSAPMSMGERPLSGTEAENAYDNLVDLSRLKDMIPGKFSFAVKIPGKTKAGAIKIDLDNPATIQNAMDRIRQNRMVQINYGNRSRTIDMGNRSDVLKLIDDIKSSVGKLEPSMPRYTEVR